jgi:hypothetical protein
MIRLRGLFRGSVVGLHKDSVVAGGPFAENCDFAETFFQGKGPPMTMLLLAFLAFAEPDTKPSAEAVPENVRAFKEKCDVLKAEKLQRLKKEVAADRQRIKNAGSDADKKKALAYIKKSGAELKAAQEGPWYSHAPPVDLRTKGSIGEFYTPGLNHTRIRVSFRPDKISEAKLIGAILHDGAVPKLLVRQGGNVARNIYSAPGAGSQTRATISCETTGWKAGDSKALIGLFEVVTTEPLELRAFDAGPYKSLK